MLLHVAQATDPEFSVAAGFVCERIAAPSLITWPVVADWDPDGNLVVVESGGVAWPIQQHNEQRLHKIVRLYDDDRDGTFDRRLVAAENLPFAEGVLAIGNRLLVAAPPNIWELIDSDGDGVCEQRSVWFDGQTVTNCANDLHGPYLGRDSWIYWCKGAFGEQTHELTDGSVLRDRAAHIFRRRLEGGPIESVIAGGMDNPVEVAFTPEGDKFFTSTFLVHPGDGQRDGIGHAVYGSVFGKKHDVIDDLIQTGPLMPVMTHLGPAAPSGLTYLEHSESMFGEVLPTADRHHSAGEKNRLRALVSAQFNLHKIAIHALRPHHDTAEPTTSEADLLTSEQVDFHPTDILEDADGSLIVIDTGGWYDLCCPSSSVDQKVASGGIYRLSREDRGAAGVSVRAAATRGVSSDSLTLASISDDRPWVRRRALFAVRERADALLPDLRELIFNPNEELEHRLDGIWALSWIGSQQALTVACDVFDMEERQPRRIPLCRAAAHVLGLHRFAAGRLPLEQALSWGDASLARAAAEALGRIGNPASIKAILNCLANARPSHTLQHACTYALIEIGDTATLEQYLSLTQPTQQQAVIIALDQLESTQLPCDRVIQAALGNDAELRQAALGILSKHPSWSSNACEALKLWWGEGLQELKDQDRKYLDLLSVWRNEADLQQLVAEWAKQIDGQPTPALRSVLHIWAGQSVPSSWIPTLRVWLREETSETCDLLAAYRLDPLEAKSLIDEISREIQTSTEFETRLSLLRLLPPEKQVIAPEMANQLIGRGEYKLLAKLKLNATQARRLAARIETADPLQLPAIIESISKAGVDQIDEGVLKRLYSLPVARTLSEGFLASLYRQRSERLRRLAKETDAILQQSPKNLRERVRETLAALPKGDPLQGLQVFRSRQTNCSVCHQMGYLGGNIGPELTRIGRTRTREALLEAILFPSARIEQSFRPTKILTVDGQVINGLVVDKHGDEIELQTTADKRLRISATEIESQEPSETSIMPGGMLDVLSEQQLADLLALLESAQ